VGENQTSSSFANQKIRGRWDRLRGLRGPWGGRRRLGTNETKIGILNFGARDLPGQGHFRAFIGARVEGGPGGGVKKTGKKKKKQKKKKNKREAKKKKHKINRGQRPRCGN